MTLTGLRTLLFGLASLGVLLAGLWLLPGDARGPAYGFLCMGVGALMAAIAGKSSVESLAGGGGTSGAWSALTTPAKPEPPPPPAAP